MELLLVTRVRVEDFELPSVPGEWQILEIFLIMMILDTRHVDVVEVVEIQQPHSLANLVAEHQLRNPTEFFGQLLRDDDEIVAAHLGDLD